MHLVVCPFFVYLIMDKEKALSIVEKIKDDMGNIIESFNNLTLTQEQEQKYLKRYDILTLDYFNAVYDYEKSMTLEDFVNDHTSFEINEDLGKLINISDLIKMIDSGEVNQESDAFYVHPDRTNIVIGYYIELENILARKHSKLFDQVFLLNEQVEIESDFIPFDQWDEEF